MSSRLIEEPEALQDSGDVVKETSKLTQNSSGTGPSVQDGPLNGSGTLGLKWDGDKWTDEIVKHACVLISTARLESRIADFMAVATAEEQEILASSREKVLHIRGEALTASKQGSATSGDDETFGERVRTAWRATTDVAYEYVQMLDVVVGQAPEYVGLAYGAIKIILVVQVNHEEVKRKVKDYLEQVQLKFKIIDHLTSYIPSSQLVTLVAQAYSLFYRFLAKAVKYYTQSRPKTWMKAVTKPWKRFQDIVDSINQTLDNVKEVAQYTGILEGHVNTIVNRSNLLLLQQNSVRMEKVIQLVEELSTKMETTSIRFSKRDDVRQAEEALRQSAEERLNEPRIGDRDQKSHRTDDDLSAMEPLNNLDLLRDVLFSELHEADEQASRNQRANEELPEMRAFRSERRNFNKSEMALAWAESHRSEILWVDGYQALTRADFNASFVFPLLQLVESRFDTVVSLRHFCESHHDGSDKYLVMMQSLVWQFLRQNPSIAQCKKASFDRERTSTTQGLWIILSELLEESKAKCVFLVIGGIDSLVNDSPNSRSLMTNMVDELHGLMDTKAQLVKVILTRGLPQPQTTTTDHLYSLVVHKHQEAPRRTLSFDAMQSRLPAISLQLTEIQEKRCQNVSFMQLPMLYTPGSILYTQEQDHLRAFVVSELSGMEQVPSGSYKALKIRAWCVDHDGTYICKRYRDFEVSPFSGRWNATALKYIPAGYLPDESTRRQELITRGRQYWSFGSGHHYRQVERNKVSKEPQRVIVDQSRRPIPSDIACQFAEQLRPEQGINVKPRFLVLTPAKVVVYDLKETAWVTVALETLTCVEFSPELHRSLILEKTQRKLLMATVQSFRNAATGSSESRRQTRDSDPIPSPGSSEDEDEVLNHDQDDWHDDDNASDSLVLLLHGAPGTGKTMTARFVANYTHRPLLSLSLAKMGADFSDLELKIKEISKLARQWGCIVLLKHADVYLAARSSANTLENNMVTFVLLQIIEDYEGILILTTNRVGIIDEALKSRIHLALDLPQLNEEGQRKIWLNLIDAQRTNRAPGIIRHTSKAFRRDIDVWKLLERPLNGRQILNTVTIAAKRAHSSRRDIRLSDLMDTLNAAHDLDNYLEKLHGVETRQRAFLRRDNWSPPPPSSNDISDYKQVIERSIDEPDLGGHREIRR